MDNPLDQFTGDTQLAKLLSELEDSFPPVTPQPNDHLSLIMYRSGQRSVIEYIKNLLEN